MQHGSPQNSRMTRPREDKNHPHTKRKTGLKKFGLRLTTTRSRWWRTTTWTRWYKKEASRDEAHRHYKIQRMWNDQNKFEYEKVEKLER